MVPVAYRNDNVVVVVAAALGLVVVVSSVACGGTPSDLSGVPSMDASLARSRSASDRGVPPGDRHGESDSVRTKHGLAVFDLAVEPRQVEPDGHVSIRMVNRGEVRLGIGSGFTVQRWEGGRWVDVPFPDGMVFFSNEPLLEAGATSDWHHTWPVTHLGETAPMQAGWYRVTKTATVAPRGGDGPDDARELVAHAFFRVES